MSVNVLNKENFEEKVLKNEKPVVVVSGCEFTVEEVKERRIERVTIVRLPEEEEKTEE